ncbi:hypothetical protein DSBG_3777 [Desulfosporosinus sp. BG]|nr:hypothetical protein DSBG_3777 [Desulfosporosinus sp. BG]
MEGLAVSTACDPSLGCWVVLVGAVFPHPATSNATIIAAKSILLFIFTSVLPHPEWGEICL